jgi:hypothetical protein
MTALNMIGPRHGSSADEGVKPWLRQDVGRHFDPIRLPDSVADVCNANSSDRNLAAGIRLGPN